MIFDAYKESALLASLSALTSVRSARTSLEEALGSRKPGAPLESFLDLLFFTGDSSTLPSNMSLFSARPNSAMNPTIQKTAKAMVKNLTGSQVETRTRDGQVCKRLALMPTR